MADQKLSDLSSGAPAQSSDLVYIARSGSQYKLTLAQAATVMVAGSDTQVLFNDGGALGADAGLTYDKSLVKFSVTSGSVNTTNVYAASDGYIGSLSANFGAFVPQVTVQTVDTTMLLTGATSNAIVMAERADASFDFAHAQQASPTFFIHSQSQSTSQWLSLTHDTARGTIATGNGPLNLQPAGNLATFGAAVVMGQNIGIGGDTAGSSMFYANYAPTTPDAAVITTGSTSNSLHIFETADTNYDFNNGPGGTSACTDPTLIIHSHNQSTTQWIAFRHNGTDGVLDVGTGTISVADNVTLQSNYLYFNTSTGGGIKFSSSTTPQSAAIMPGTTSNSIHIYEVADQGYDFNNGTAGTSAQTDPTLIIHSHNQSTTQYIQFNHDGTNGNIAVGVGVLTLPIINASSDTNGQGFYFGGSSYASAGRACFVSAYQNSSTVAGATIGVDETGRRLNIVDKGDIASDVSPGTNATNPTLYIGKAASPGSTTGLNINYAAVQSRIAKTLTEAGGDEVIFSITLTAGQMTGGQVDYTVRATDGTDFAARCGTIRFVALDNAGTVAATLSGADQTADGSVLVNTNSKTLTYAITANVATANVFKLAFNIDSDMTVNAASIDYLVTLTGPGEVVPV